MKKVYLHIGTEKTGTTSIQKSLSSYNTKSSDAIFYYPQEGIVSDHHYNIAKRNFSKESLIQEIDSAPSDVVVLSSEHFCMLREQEDVFDIYNSLHGYHIEVLIYFRSPQSYLSSLYGEHIKWGGKVSIDQFYNKSRWRFDYKSLVEKWRTVFGNENVKLFDYEAIGDVVSHFYDVIGASSMTANTNDTSKENKSDPRYFLEIVRRFNSVFPKLDTRDFLVDARKLNKRVPAPSILKDYDWQIKQEIRSELKKEEELFNQTFKLSFFKEKKSAKQQAPNIDLESAFSKHFLDILATCRWQFLE